jgi:hypothetical protein
MLMNACNNKECDRNKECARTRRHLLNSTARKIITFSCENYENFVRRSTTVQKFGRIYGR